MNPTQNSVAFGAPGIEPRWTSSAKEGLGTAYHTSCRVWFTLSHGIVNEIYYPCVDEPNTRDFQLLITDGETPPCATAIPLLPHRRRRWVSPRSFHQSPTTSVLRCDQREHRGGCRPSFPLDAFPPPETWLRRWCVRSALSGARRQHRPLARPTNCA